MHRNSAAPTVASSLQIAPAAVESTRPSWPLLIGAGSGLAAAWVAAGSTGLVAHGLRHALTWLLLGGSIVLAWPRGIVLWQRIALMVAMIVAVAMTASSIQAVNLFAAPVVLAALAGAQSGSAKRVIVLCAQAAALLAIVRFAQYASSAFWHLSDVAAGGIGQAAGLISGEPLNVGLTFAGLDFLLVMAVLLAAMFLTRGVSWSARIAALGSVIVAQFLYLAVLADSERILASASSLKQSRQLAALSELDRSRILTQRSAAVKHLAATTELPGDELRALIVKTGRLPDDVRRADRDDFFDAIKTDVEAAYAQEMQLPGRRSPYTWDALLLAAVPWNLPVLALMLHLPIAVVMLSIVAAKGGSARHDRVAPAMLAMAAALAVILAFLTHYAPGPAEFRGKNVVAYKHGFLNWMKAEYGDMQSNMNFGRLSIGMYGMMRPFVESLGMNFRLSDELYTPEYVNPDGDAVAAVDDLAEADILILLYPNRRWKQSQLDRIQEFVEEGGSLLVMGEHTIVDGVSKEQEAQRFAAEEDKNRAPVPGDAWAGEEENAIRVNELLERFGIEVAFDSAEFTVGGWLQSYATVSHPTTAGIRDERNTFGAVIGASIEPDRLARPLLIGRYGKGDYGNVEDTKGHGSYMGDSLYNSGERLGDLVLAVEKRVGRGRVIAFGDTSTLTNGVNMSAHPFTSRLLAYLATPQHTPQDAAPAIVAGVLLVLCAAAVCMWPSAMLIATLSATLGVSAWIAVALTEAGNRIVPDGRLIDSFVTVKKESQSDLIGGTPADIEQAVAKRGNNLAYIDTSHLESFSEESLRLEGIQGLELTLMRNNYLTLMLPEFTAQRLLDDEPPPGQAPSIKARLLVSVAPQRPFTTDEADVLKQFVARGGIWIVTAGYDESGPIRDLLDEFGYEIGEYTPDIYHPQNAWPSQPRDRLQPPEPTPLGHLKTQFFSTADYAAFVRFHAAWPIRVRRPERDRTVTVAFYDPEHLLIGLTRYEKGMVAVIGDTGFAMNKNLEDVNGWPIEGMRENAVFWRWFLSLLEDRADEPVWVPPKPQVIPVPSAEMPDNSVQPPAPPASESETAAEAANQKEPD